MTTWLARSVTCSATKKTPRTSLRKPFSVAGAQDGLDEIHNLRAWIFRVALNAAKDLLRSAWRRRTKSFQGVEIMEIVSTAEPRHEMENQEFLQQIRQALLDLRPEEKEVFLLRQNGELSYEQIAEISNRSVGTVKIQMRHALQKLRKVLV